MKKWLVERFLPMWAKQTVLSDNQRLQVQNQRLQQQVDQLESYIRGMKAALRACKYPWENKQKET